MSDEGVSLPEEYQSASYDEVIRTPCPVEYCKVHLDELCVDSTGLPLPHPHPQRVWLNRYSDNFTAEKRWHKGLLDSRWRPW